MINANSAPSRPVTQSNFSVSIQRIDNGYLIICPDSVAVYVESIDAEFFVAFDAAELAFYDRINSPKH